MTAIERAVARSVADTLLSKMDVETLKGVPA